MVRLEKPHLVSGFLEDEACPLDAEISVLSELRAIAFMIKGSEPMRPGEGRCFSPAHIEHPPAVWDRPMSLAHKQACAWRHQRNKRLKSGSTFWFVEVHPNRVEHDDVKQFRPRFDLREVWKVVLQPGDFRFRVKPLRAFAEFIRRFDRKDSMAKRHKPRCIASGACTDI